MQFFPSFSSSTSSLIWTFARRPAQDWEYLANGSSRFSDKRSSYLSNEIISGSLVPSKSRSEKSGEKSSEKNSNVRTKQSAMTKENDNPTNVKNPTKNPTTLNPTSVVNPRLEANYLESNYKVASATEDVRVLEDVNVSEDRFNRAVLRTSDGVDATGNDGNNRVPTTAKKTPCYYREITTSLARLI